MYLIDPNNSTEKEHDTKADCLFCIAGKQFESVSTKCSSCSFGSYQHENSAPSVQCKFCIQGQAAPDSKSACEACIN